MKAIKTTIITLALTLSSMVAMAQPMNYESMRMNARFLTDRIAYTLGIRDPYTIDALYQINYDYIYGVNDYLDDVALGYRYDDYMTVCYARDYALERLLGRALWTTLMGYDYFYRPISFLNHRWSFGIYAHDHRTTYFYHAVPGHFHDYRGGHYFVGMRPMHGGNRVGPRHDWNSPVHHSAAHHRPHVEADRHGNYPNNNGANRPGYSIGGNNRPGNSVGGSDRPGYSGNNGSSSNRPGYSVGGNNGSSNNRPGYSGNNGGSNNRPGYSAGGNSNRPSYSGNNGGNSRPGTRSEGNMHSSSRARTSTAEASRSGNVSAGRSNAGGHGYSGGGGSRGGQNNGGGRGR